jgi:hypothetical protein
MPGKMPPVFYMLLKFLKDSASRLIRMVRQKEFSLLLFFIFFLLFNFPFLLDLKDKPLSFPYKFYFGSWLILIIILFVANYKAGDSD